MPDDADSTTAFFENDVPGVWPDGGGEVYAVPVLLSICGCPPSCDKPVRGAAFFEKSTQGAMPDPGDEKERDVVLRMLADDNPLNNGIPVTTEGGRIVNELVSIIG